MARKKQMKVHSCTFLGKPCSGRLSRGFLGHQDTGSRGNASLPGSSELTPLTLPLVLGWKTVTPWREVREVQDTQFLQMQMACEHLITGRWVSFPGKVKPEAQYRLWVWAFTLACGVFGTHLSNLYPWHLEIFH